MFMVKRIALAMALSCLSEGAIAQGQPQGVKIGRGDVVLFHTGWMVDKMPSDKNLYRSNAPGFGGQGLPYFADLGVPRIVGTVQSVIDPIAIRFAEELSS
jgi:kynurenine formamidase